MMSGPLQLNHLRARAAHTLVEAVARMQVNNGAVIFDKKDGGLRLSGAAEASKDKTISNFGSYVRAFPVLIHRAGLLQSLAFCNAKAKARRLLAFCLLNWLRQCSNSNGMAPLTAGDPAACNAFYDELLESDAGRIRVLTSEAQAFLLWLKQFSDARFGESDDQPDD